MNRRVLVLTATLLLVSVWGSAQPPHDDWRTLTTERFRIHYPAPYEEWARHAAGKLEEARAMVAPVVGYAPPEVTDVIIADPLAVPNGSAWPFIGSPRMVLWASPPGPGSILSHQSDWAELVVIHEDAHLAHLLRPSRNRLESLRWITAPVRVGPVRRAPRWVTEGYATLIEGQLTGMGRPHGDMRAAILRRWAQEGRLPTYSRLASDSSSWLGQSMAYLVGSAYLEWLVEREGQESLRALWARLTARQQRSFDQAFEGVYGDSPQRLYQRFAAELTRRAMEVEEALSPSLVEGELFQDFTWFTEWPDLSGDGTELLTVRRPREGAASIVILSTEPDTEAEEKRRTKIEEMLRKDPDDVAPVRRRPAARTPKHRLSRGSGAVPQTPRWIRETGDVLFVEFVPDLDGTMHPDLFRWNPKSGDVRRLTFGADLRDADPFGGGTEAIAVRQRYGKSQLVRVSLASGEIVPLTDATIAEVYGHPRVSPDGKRFAYVVQRSGSWHLAVRELETGEEISRTFEGTVAYPAWSRDGAKLYASVGSNGFVDIVELGVERRGVTAVRPITRSSTPLFGPAPGEAAIYFLGMDADGIDVRRLDLAATYAPLSSIDVPSALEPAVRVVSEVVRSPLTPQPLGEAVPYGFGRQEISPILGGAFAGSSGTFEAGFRMGDVVGRTEVLGVASISSRGAAEGAVLSGVSRRWPVALSISAVAVEERTSEQRLDEPFVPLVADRERVALELEGSKELQWRVRRILLASGGYVGRIEPVAGDAVDQWGVFGRIRYAGRPTVGLWAYPQSASLDVAVGSTDGRSYTRVVGQLSFGATFKRNGVEIEAERGDMGEDANEFDRFEVGGLMTSVHSGTGLFGNRVWAPALPYGVMEGSSFTRLRGTVHTSFLPVKAFYERIETSRGALEASVDVAGIEIEIEIEAMPLVKIPRAVLSAGAAIVLDAPLEDEVRGWVGIRWGW